MATASCAIYIYIRNMSIKLQMSLKHLRGVHSVRLGVNLRIQGYSFEGSKMIHKHQPIEFSSFLPDTRVPLS